MAQMASSDHFDELVRRYSGRISGSSSASTAGQQLEMADALMAEWGAINFTLEDVKTLLGDPTTSEGDVIEYRFDHGFGGAVWRFRAENDRVVAVERTPLE